MAEYLKNTLMLMAGCVLLIGLFKPERIFCFGGKRTRGRVVLTWGFIIFIISVAGSSVKTGIPIEEINMIKLVGSLLFFAFLGGSIIGLIKPNYITCFGLKRNRLIVLLVWVLPLLLIYGSSRYLSNFLYQGYIKKAEEINYSGDKPKAAQSKNWNFIISNAYRTANNYATKWNPASVFVCPKNNARLTKQVAGEHKGNYLLTIVCNHGGDVSFALLLPNFDMNKSTDKLNDSKTNIWKVLYCKFNGREY